MFVFNERIGAGRRSGRIFETDPAVGIGGDACPDTAALDNLDRVPDFRISVSCIRQREGLDRRRTFHQQHLLSFYDRRAHYV